MNRRKYRWRVVWLVVWVAAVVVTIGTAVYHLNAGASGWRFGFDALRLLLFSVAAADRWNAVKKAHHELAETNMGF